MILTNNQPFSILDHKDKLTPAKEKGKYICPICNGDNLSINLNTGAYQCFNGCDCSSIRDKVSPLDRKSRSIEKLPSNHIRQLPPLPAGNHELAKQPNQVIDCPLKSPDEYQDKKDVVSITYPYSPTQYVKRYEWANPKKSKGYEKVFHPYHLDNKGRWVSGKGDAPWLPYRLEEVKQYGSGKWILGVEGEKCVEAGRWLRLVATTVQGSNWAKENLVELLQNLKSTGVTGMYYWADLDDTGIQKAEKLEEASICMQFPVIVLDPKKIWSGITEKQDIYDWIHWGGKENMNKEDLIQKLEEAFQLEIVEYQQNVENSLNSVLPEEELEHKLLTLLKETAPVKRLQQRSEIQQLYGYSKADIDQALKELNMRTKQSKLCQVDLVEQWNSPRKGIDYVIPGMLPVGETVVLAADPKTGKTLLAYDAAFAVVTGESNFLGEKVKQGKVLIIQVDEHQNNYLERLFKRGFCEEDLRNLDVIERFQISQLEELEGFLQENNYVLVIIDCLRAIVSDSKLKEEAPEFSDVIYKLKGVFAKYNTSVILIHHTKKDKNAVGIDKVRGTSGIAGAAWGVWILESVIKSDPVHKGKKIIDPRDTNRIFSIIARDVEGQRLRIELDPEQNHWINHGEENTDEAEYRDSQTHGERVAALLKSVSPLALGTKQIDEKLNIGSGLCSILNRLVTRKIISSRKDSSNKRKTVYFYTQQISQQENHPSEVRNSTRPMNPSSSHLSQNSSHSLNCDESVMNLEIPIEQGLQSLSSQLLSSDKNHSQSGMNFAQHREGTANQEFSVDSSHVIKEAQTTSRHGLQLSSHFHHTPQSVIDSAKEVSDSSTLSSDLKIPSQQFVLGDKVEHPEYGQGTVTYGGRIDERIFINFSCGSRSPNGKELTLIKPVAVPEPIHSDDIDEGINPLFF